MINALSIIGVSLVAIGVVVFAKGLMGFVRGVAKKGSYRRRLREMAEEAGPYQFALARHEVYQPYTILKGMGFAVLGLVVLAHGLLFAWAGVRIEDFDRVGSESVLLARVSARRDVVAVDPVRGVAAKGPLVGSVLVAHGQVFEFKGLLASLGLGTRIPFTHLASYQDTAGVLSRRGLDRLQVARTHHLVTVLETLASRFPDAFGVTRRFSSGVAVDSGDLEVWATGDGIEWRQ